MPSNPVTLEDAIALVASQAAGEGVSLTRTKLVKLLYFIDLRAWEQLGHTVTGVEWIWHHYGPYSSSVVEACNRMSAAGELQVTEATNYYGSQEWRIQATQTSYYDPPGHDLVSLVRVVVGELGGLSPSEIGDLSYETAPMRRLVANDGRRGDFVEFESAAPTRDDVRAAVGRYTARARVLESVDEGNVGDGLREELAAFEHGRRSASTQLLAR